MNTNNGKNWTATDWHPEDEDLLMSLDGELEPTDAQTVRAHLDCCWSCRSRSERLQSGISAFIDYNDAVLTPLVRTSSENRRNFGNRLQKAVEESVVNVSWFRHLINRFNLSIFQFNQVIIVRSSVAAFLITTLLTAFLFFGNRQTVSASELLDKSINVQNKKVSKVSQPVIYQKFRVRALDQTEFGLEIWNDAENLRYRRSIGGERLGEKADLLQSINQILQKNQMNPQELLAPQSFKSWRDSLTDKTDSISEGETVTLKTVNNRATTDGQIIEAVMKFRPHDFHAFEETIKVKIGDSEKTFEIAEINFEVIALNSLKHSFFDETQTQIAQVGNSAPLPLPAAEANANTTSNANANLASENNKNLALTKPEFPNFNASPELEVEILDLLNRAKADLGEQITVRREVDGALSVSGFVETLGRKNEIFQALQSVRNNPAVRINIKTIDEAVAEQKSTAKPLGSSEKVESQSLETAADSELLAYFKSEQTARAFSKRMIAHSGRAMSRAYALKRLISQFKPEDLRGLSPEAKSKLLNLISVHARAFREETAVLRQELQPVFEVPDVGASNAINVDDITDVPGAIASLFEFASTNNQIVQSAFTVSSSNAQFTAIKTKQFWQSLRNAESLAAKLQAVK